MTLAYLLSQQTNMTETGGRRPAGRNIGQVGDQISRIGRRASSEGGCRGGGLTSVLIEVESWIRAGPNSTAIRVQLPPGTESTNLASFDSCAGTRLVEHMPPWQGVVSAQPESSAQSDPHSPRPAHSTGPAQRAQATKTILPATNMNNSYGGANVKSRVRIKWIKGIPVGFATVWRGTHAKSRPTLI